MGRGGGGIVGGGRQREEGCIKMHPSPPPLTDQWNLNISIAHKYTGIKNDVQYCMLKKY